MNADAVKAYDITRDFFLKLGYIEVSAVRPTLLTLKKRGRLCDLEGNVCDLEDCRITLKAKINPLGNLQLYSSALTSIRCEYIINLLGQEPTANLRNQFESEVEKLKSLLKETLLKSSTPKPEASINIESSGQKKETSVETPQIPTMQPQADRIKSGFADLDNLLLGGIPEKYAIVMTSPSSDERDLLIKNFLEAGVKESQTTFYISTNPGVAKNLAEENPSTFFLFVCNPRADAIIPNTPNVYKLKGVENLTEIEIALCKAFRPLGSSQNTPRRACIEILSDVLLQHHAVITRKWMSGLLADLKANGFTVLAIINPHMHPSEEVQAILGLFDGEIKISETETNKGVQKSLRIRKLCNKEYLENEITLTKEKLSSKNN